MATEAKVVAPSIGLCEALDSPSLLGRDLVLSPRQREPCEAIDGGARLVVMEWGRRAFKTGVLSLIALWHCLPRPEFEEFIRPGEMRRALAFATTMKQARQVIAAAGVTIDSSKVLRPMVESRTDLEVRFKHGVVLVAMPANAAGDRGHGGSCVLLDEHSHHFDGDADAPKSAESLLAAAVPMTSSFGPLATVAVASTPSGESNSFARLCDDIVENPSPTAAYFFGASWEINPRLSKEKLERGEERRLLGPELWSQEYECNRLAGGGSFLSADSIEACVTDGGDIPYEAGLEFFVGIDPAMSSDTFGCVVLGVERNDPSRFVVAQVHGWQGEKSESFEQARLREDELLQRVVAVCREYHVETVATDVYKAREIRYRLAGFGINVVDVPFTGDGRRAVFTTLRLVIDEGRIDLPREPQLLAELRALRVKYTAAGQVVEIPRLAGKSHCDRAVSLALVLAAREEGNLEPVGGEGPTPGSRLPAEIWDDPIDSWGSESDALSGPSTPGHYGPSEYS